MEESYDCIRCGKHFTTKPSLFTHLRMKRTCLPIQSDISVQEIMAEYNKDTEVLEEVECDRCGKKVSNKYTLTKHKKTQKCMNHVVEADSRDEVSLLREEVERLKEKMRNIIAGEVGSSSGGSSIVNSNNTTTRNIQNTNNIQNTIVMNVFGREKTDFITDHPQFEELMTKRLTSEDGVHQYFE